MRTPNPPKQIPNSVTAVLIGLALLLLAGNLSQASNVLLNPGFETGNVNAPWNKYGVFDMNTAANTYYNGGGGGSNVWIYDGVYAGKTYGQFTGGDNYNGVYQDVSAAP